MAKSAYSTRGKSIKFKTGAYKGLWKGTWRKTKSVLTGATGYAITLTALKDEGVEGVPTLECDRD